MESESLKLARFFLGKKVEVTMDRPLGSKHPKHGFLYEVNYGYIEGVMSPDGEELDTYYLGDNNDDDKLVVVPNGVILSDEEILKQVNFQEKWFKSVVIRE